MCTGMTSYNKPEMNKSTTVAILATICRDVCIYGCTNNRCGLDEPELDERCQRCVLAQIKEVTLK